jgi:hypothetical protein
MKKANLPAWATAIAPGKIEIDAEQFYPELIDELWSDDHWPAEGQPMADIQRKKLDQYWLEVAHQCAKLDVQFAVAGTELMPKTGGALVILVKPGKTDYAQKKYPAGRGVEAAAKGLEARAHYKRIRQLPTL